MATKINKNRRFDVNERARLTLLRDFTFAQITAVLKRDEPDILELFDAEREQVRDLSIVEFLAEEVDPLFLELLNITFTPTGVTASLHAIDVALTILQHVAREYDTMDHSKRARDDDNLLFWDALRLHGDDTVDHMSMLEILLRACREHAFPNEFINS